MISKYKICAKCKHKFIPNDIEYVFCSSTCRAHVKKRNKKNYILNRDKIIQDVNSWCLKNPQKTKINKSNWYNKNKDKISVESKIKYNNNKKMYALKSKSYYELNKSKIKKQVYEYRKNRLKYDIEFKILIALRKRIYNALIRGYKYSSTKELLGCSILELKFYLESQFKPGMSWDNWALAGWHIDHIRPCCSFDLKKLEEQQKCFNYKNLQPLWAKENLKKGGKYEPTN